jgi:hypothetical protein
MQAAITRTAGRLSAPRSGPSIRRASAEAAHASDASLAARQAARIERRTVDVVDCVLDVIEEINLSDLGEEAQEALVGEWLLWLDDAVAAPVPVPVRNAGTATALHDALLDWQDELFDDLVPSRAAHQEADRECFAGDGAW